MQLIAKAKVLEITGSSPETHNLREILGILYLVTKDERIRKFVEENREILITIEDAYFLARYFPRKYEREEAELCLKITKKFFWNALLEVKIKDIRKVLKKILENKEKYFKNKEIWVFG